MGVYPYQWKFANVIPLFKKNDRQSKVNYRPVSLLCSLSKIMEKVVFIRLYNYLLEIDSVAYNRVSVLATRRLTS